MNHPLHLTSITLLLAASNLPAATHYVSLGSANPTPLYTNWVTAATNIQQTLNAAAAADVVVVTNGVYAGRVNVTNALTLLSANGPQFTVIDGGGAIGCAYLRNRAILSGFTLTNGVDFYNTASSSGANYDGNTANYCCTMPLPTSGVANITNAPLFVDYAGGNLRLQSNSPCINSGNNAYVSGTTDLDGNPRIVSGTVDIGAYEYQGTGSVISYAWLQQYGLPTDGTADFADPDHDGLNNWQEWICGTCPTNALSVLRLLSPSITSTNATVSWQSVAGVNYFLERSANLTSPFMLLATNIVGQAGTTSYGDTNGAGPGPFFYRVGVKPF